MATSPTIYITAMNARVKVEGKRLPVVLKRGSTVPDGADEAQVERLLKLGAACTEAQWHAGEKVPHHKRQPHRGNANPRYGRTVDPPNPDDVPAENKPAPEDDEPPPAINEMSDESLHELWSGKTPKVNDIVDMVGDDAALAQRVIAVENDALAGQPRSTLIAKMEAVIEAGE